MMKTYERTLIRLLKGQPQAKPFGKLIDGRFVTGTLSLHRTPQSRAWRRFIKMRERVDKIY